LIDFLKALENNKTKIKIVNILRRDMQEAEVLVLKSLGVRSKFELNDRLDGTSFNNTFRKKIIGVVAIEKYLKVRLIDWTSVNPKSYLPIVEIEHHKILILNSSFGTLSKFPENHNGPIIVTVTKDDKTIWVMGVLTKHPKSKNNIISFDTLHEFDTLSDLKNILE